MESSSRQSDILQKLQQIRRELAKKERKLQKLKRLSAHKRSLESGESSSIGPEETLSSAGADVYPPLHPIETTLSQREICQSKSLRAVRPEDESLLARTPQSEARVGSAHCFVQSDRTEGSEPPSPVLTVELIGASAGRRALAPAAFSSRACRVPGESSATELQYSRRPQIIPPLSSAPACLAVEAASAVSESSTCDVLDKDTSALNVSECFSSSLSSGILAGNCENKNEAEVHATLCGRLKDEIKFCAKNSSPLLAVSCDTHNADLLESSQKEMFEDSEMCWASQDTHFSGRNHESKGVIQLSTTQNTESTEPPCQTTEVLELLSSKSCSPARKRQRTVCEQTASTDSANAKNYNFRKRGLSCASPPLERGRVGRDAKTVLNAFHKLVKQALELPVSMFHLHFEKLGLPQYLDARGLSGHQAVNKNSESTANNSELLHGCSDKTGASLLAETDMSIGGNTLLEVQKSQRSRSVEPVGTAMLLPKSMNTDSAQLGTPFFETRTTQCSHRQRRQCILPSAISLVNGTVEDSITAATLSAGQQHKRSTRAAHHTMSVCALTVDHTGNGQRTEAPLESSHVEHVSPETELPSAAQLHDVADGYCAASACPMKGCSEVQALSPSSSGVCKVGDSCHLVECRNSTSVHEVSGREALIAACSCKISALEGHKGATVEAPSQDISARLQCANRDPLSTLMIKSPKGGEGEVKSGINGAKKTPTNFPSAAYSRSGHSSQKSNRSHAERAEDHVGKLSSSQSSIDGQSLENGEIDRTGITGKEVAMCSPAPSTLFTQSEDSDGAEGAMTDLVTNVVEQLGSQENSTVNHTAADQHGDHVTILSDSATPDDLDIPEVQASILASAPGAPLPLPLCCGQENVLTEVHGPEPERDAESADLLCSLRAHCQAQDDSSEGTADSASRDPVAGPPEEGKWPSSADPASSSSAQEQAQKETVAGAPCASSRYVAKRLFADSSGTDECQAANSEVAELLDAQELEGMFDEWSEECAIDTATRPATVRSAVDSRTVTFGSDAVFNRSHSSTKEAAQSVLAEQQAAAVHLESSSQKDLSYMEADGAECGSPNPWNQGQMGPDLHKLEYAPTNSLARSDTEAGRNLPQCSSPSTSLEALSGISKFSDEVCGRRDTTHHAEERQLNSSTTVHLGGKCIGGWCDEDCDEVKQNCADTVDDQDTCDAAAYCCGSLLGTHNPLFFFCALKCEQEQPVMAMYLVRAKPCPFLVSVQALAVTVWHLEHNTWRHSMSAGKLRFPVEGGERCLLCCGEWSVLAYLSPLTPTHVPCVQWRTTDGGGKVQLMLTLGSLANGLTRRKRSLYRMAKLDRDGWFVTALRTARGATLLRIHRLRYVCGELGDETESLGRTSNLLNSLVGIEGRPDALLGNSANIFYVWDCESRLLVKKMIHEPDVFADLHHISWCCSDRGLLFVLMRSSDDVTSTLVAMNPFSCKAEAVSSSSWKMAAQARTSDSRPCDVHVEGQYAACVCPGYGVRIWNLLTGNAVADMWYHSSTCVTMTDVSGTTFVAVGSASGRVLVFTS